MSQTLPERRQGGAAERWEPFSELEQVTERMRRLLDQTFGGVGWTSTGERAAWSPPVDLEETDDAYVVTADLPGVKRERVNVELVGDELAITGEKKQDEDEERKGTMRQQARRTGRFAYRIGLRGHLDPEGVEAKLADGVLNVRVPKSERAQRRQIEITGS